MAPMESDSVASIGKDSDNSVKSSEVMDKKSSLMQNVLDYEKVLDKRLKEIIELMNSYDKGVKAAIAGMGDKRKGGIGGMEKKRESLYMEMFRGIERNVVDIGNEWGDILGEVVGAVAEKTEQVTLEGWENTSCELFSGFECSSIGDEGKGGKVGGTGETVHECENDEKEGDKSGDGERSENIIGKDSSGRILSIEEGFARMERVIERRIEEEMKKIESRWSEKMDNRDACGGEGNGKGSGQGRSEGRGKVGWGFLDWRRSNMSSGGNGVGGEMVHNRRSGVGVGKRNVVDEKVNKSEGESFGEGGGVGGVGKMSRKGGEANERGGEFDEMGSGCGEWCSRLLSQFELGTTVEDIARVVGKFNKECEIVKIGTANEHWYASFVITYRVEDKVLFERDGMWPEEVRCKRFFDRPRRIIGGKKLMRDDGGGGM